MDRYDFVLAGKDDIVCVAEFWYSLIGTPGSHWRGEYPNVDRAREDVDGGMLYLLKDGDEIVASVTIHPSEKHSVELFPALEKPCEISRLGVARHMQRQGIGRMMTERAVELSKQMDYDGMGLLVSKYNSFARRMYDKIGFELCGEVTLWEIDFVCYQMVF